MNKATVTRGKLILYTVTAATLFICTKMDKYRNTLKGRVDGEDGRHAEMAELNYLIREEAITTVRLETGRLETVCGFFAEKG